MTVVSVVLLLPLLPKNEVFVYLFCNATLCCFLKESVRHARDVEANFSSERTPSHTTDWCHYFLLWRKGFLRTLKPNAKYCHEVCTYKLTTKCFPKYPSQYPHPALLYCASALSTSMFSLFILPCFTPSFRQTRQLYISLPVNS